MLEVDIIAIGRLVCVINRRHPVAAKKCIRAGDLKVVGIIRCSAQPNKWYSSSARDNVLLAPPYTATEEELEEILDKLVASIDQVTDAAS